MYCIKCGVKLADTEKKCPLCETEVYHPHLDAIRESTLYPSEKMPDLASGLKALNGAIVMLFVVPILACFLVDLLLDGRLDWFGYVLGASVVAYTIIALPLWFKAPNPVIFVPCNFVVSVLFLFYINFATKGTWFLSFAFPVTGGLCLITCAIVTLLYYLHRGRLYVVGGGFISLGALMFLVEYLLMITFDMKFIGWSIYPLVILVMLGTLLIYLAFSRPARELLQRKLFF